MGQIRSGITSAKRGYQRGLTERGFERKTEQQKFYGDSEKRARSEYEKRRARRYNNYEPSYNQGTYTY